MRDPARIERVLDLIKQIWNKSPDLRFNQLIDNLSWSYTDEKANYIEYSYSKFENEKGVQFLKDVANVDLFYVEDDKFELFLQDYLEKFK
jgi:hypothetical protein